MITKDQQKTLMDTLKSNWASDVLALLKARKIRNRHGKCHTKGNVRQVMYGNLESPQIEQAILDVYEDTIKKADQLEQRKKNLLIA